MHSAQPSPETLSRPERRERRLANRAVAVLRVARLITEQGDQLCVVRNVSPTGVMVDTAQPPAPGDAIWLEFSTTVKVRGIVRWVVDYRFGVEFDAATDILKALDQPIGRLRRQRSRAPRFVRDGKVQIGGTARPAEGTILNISLGGVRAAVGQTDLTPGMRVTLTIPGLAKHDGQVRWIRSGIVGIWFNRPLHFSDLALWLTGAAAD
ncbi:PilZ domain-containing protein [Sphingomonas immobilis]|uniref:PilZ domain-containing protein n=1 Tax=Sphingomonas immobilis TaxID=3063997 RepID=A0ABT9A1J9_9SPHN|nr:PilZ domain-containing protein [Sphingomonas sp. CA1-15]MDO7843259.1 PilZ domain-containing protein [Sphingomonas sp. CA1-15]